MENAMELKKAIELAYNACAGISFSRDDASIEMAKGCIHALEAYLGVDTSWEACYALGYCWYMLPVEVDDRDEKIEYWLMRSLILEPKNQYAKLYLGHYYYDKKAYKKAFAYLRNIPKNYFKQFDQQWRDLKVQELIICCGLFEKGVVFEEDMTQGFVEQYLSSSEEDIDLPREIVSALVCQIIHNERSLFLIDLAKLLLKIIYQFDYRTLFEKEVAIIEEYVGLSQ